MTGLPRHDRGHWSPVTWRRVLLAAITTATMTDVVLAALVLHQVDRDGIGIALVAVAVLALIGGISLYYAGHPEDHPIHGREGHHRKDQT